MLKKFLKKCTFLNQQNLKKKKKTTTTHKTKQNPNNKNKQAKPYIPQ